MTALGITSLQAPIADAFCRELTRFLARRLGRAAEFVDDEPWRERERRLDEGGVDVAWICGLPYVRRRAADPASVEPLAAPVMAEARYGGRPVYFSDVVVRADSPYGDFTDLAETRWAYNEPGSHSGYGITLCELARAGLGGDFFGQTVEAGYHQVAIELVLEGEVDATAVDSTVLEAMRALRPALGEELRIIASWGPSPMPPWVAAGHLEEETRQRLTEELCAMHLDDEGRDLLATARMSRFARVGDADYDDIRRMESEGRGLTL